MYYKADELKQKIIREMKFCISQYEEKSKELNVALRLLKGKVFKEARKVIKEKKDELRRQIIELLGAIDNVEREY